MRVGRRFVDALRNPRRLFGLVVRIGQIVHRGELGALLSRARHRGATPQEYNDWKFRQAPLSAPVAHVRCVIALDFEGDVERGKCAATLRSTARATHRIVARAPSGGWIDVETGDHAPLARWIAEDRAAWIWWIAAPVELTADAAAALAVGCGLLDARVVYADHEVVDAQATIVPCFKSAWDRIQVRERPYAGPFLAVRSELADAVERSRGDGQAGQWRFLTDAIDEIPERCIVHVPRVIARVVQAADRWHEPTPVVAKDSSPILVSLVIPTRDRADLVERCLESVHASRGRDDLEIVVVDNGSKDPKLASLLRHYASRMALRTIALDVPFNFPILCNAGVEASRGRVVVLLNNDTEVTRGWLDELVPLALRSDVGAVGPLLVYPDGALQSAGVLVGVNRTATSALEGFDPNDSQARAWCACRRRVSAVLGACIAIEREKYLRVGGMDVQLAVSHNEVDFCLRLEAAGFANVFTPFARIAHAEGASRGFEVTAAERARLSEEERRFAQRWRSVLDAIDPAHHPAFARYGNPFLLSDRSTMSAPRSGWRTLVSVGPRSDGAHAG